MTIGSVEDHRSREGGAMVYPVYSRRSGGLSIGVNLFPGRKMCSFDCPYCEVFPFETDIVFNPLTMAAALRSAIKDAGEHGIAVKDLCFSGSGEPSMAVHFTEALEAAAKIRNETAPDAKLVLITNGAGLLDKAMFDFLAAAASSAIKLQIWLKLDAGTADWYTAINRSYADHGELLACIREFSAAASFTVQTMICTVHGRLPPPEESAAWVRLVTELAEPGTRAKAETGEMQPAKMQMGLNAVQIYGKARPAPEDPLAEAAPAEALEERAAMLRLALDRRGITVPVTVYE